MPTIFTKIIKGEIPSHKIAEDDLCYAFLDIAPLAKGHTLVVPKQEIDYIFDINDDVLAHLHVFSKKIAKALEKVVPCKRIGVAIIGLEVPHAHIHLIPLNSMNDINFSLPKLSLPKEELAEIAEKIRKQL